VEGGLTPAASLGTGAGGPEVTADNGFGLGAGFASAATSPFEVPPFSDQIPGLGRTAVNPRPSWVAVTLAEWVVLDLFIAPYLVRLARPPFGP